MRVKTESRRATIVQVAWEVFRERGFQGATMSEISERIGGSKATLYGYFASKNELFVAALKEVLRDSIEESYSLLTGRGDLRVRLISFARHYMALRMRPDIIAVDRAMISEAERTDIAQMLREEFFIPNWLRLAKVMADEMASGSLRKSDPGRAGIQLRALVESDLLNRRLHGDTSVTEADVETEVLAGVDAFLRIYAPDN